MLMRIKYLSIRCGQLYISTPSYLKADRHNKTYNLYLLFRILQQTELIYSKYIHRHKINTGFIFTIFTAWKHLLSLKIYLMS